MKQKKKWYHCDTIRSSSCQLKEKVILTFLSFAILAWIKKAKNELQFPFPLDMLLDVFLSMFYM